MNILDICLIVIAVGIWRAGSRYAVAAQLSALLAITSGLFIGSLAYTKLAYLADNSLVRSIVLILLIATLSFLFFDIFSAFNHFLLKRRRAKHHGTSPLAARLCCAVIVALSLTTLLTWILNGLSNSSAYSLLRQQVGTSKIMTITNDAAYIPDILRKTAELIEPFAQPRAFAKNEPAFEPKRPNQDFGRLHNAIKNATPSVYKVVAWGCGGTSRGTGFVVGTHYIVTAAHVIAGADRVNVEFNGLEYSARAVRIDPSVDYAVLWTDAQLSGTPLRFHTAQVAASTIGSILGYPGGGDFVTTNAVVQSALAAKGWGIYGIKNVTRTIYVLQADISPGDSGAPLINEAGEVLALAFGHSESQQHTAYALTAAQIAPGVEDSTRQNHFVDTGACTD